jgi:hypothetical protein
MMKGQLKLFRVVEAYPQATVTRVLLVRAASARQAGEDPHAQDVLSAEYAIDQGGEARTESVAEVPPIDNPSGRHYYRQVFTVEVLSDEPVDFDSLQDMHRAIDSGPCSGVFHLSHQEEVTAVQMMALLEAQGSDPGFLLADEDLPEQTEKDP